MSQLVTPETTAGTLESTDDHEIHVVLPKLLSMARYALPNILEGTVWPFVIFYVFLVTTSVWGALLAALAYSYIGVAWRIRQGKRVSGLLALTTITLTVRTILGLASGSVVVYFLQPSLAKAALAIGLLLSLQGKEPLLVKLARDFVPLPDNVMERPCVRRFFTHATVLWVVLLLGHSAAATYVLLNESVNFYVAFKSVLNLVVKGGGIGLTFAWFVVIARRNGMKVSFA
jgi:intracellular septation protein A